MVGSTKMLPSVSTLSSVRHRARQLYKNISMLFLFPVKDGKLSIQASVHVSYRITVSFQ